MCEDYTGRGDLNQRRFRGRIALVRPAGGGIVALAGTFRAHGGAAMFWLLLATGFTGGMTFLEQFVHLGKEFQHGRGFGQCLTVTGQSGDRPGSALRLKSRFPFRVLLTSSGVFVGSPHGGRRQARATVLAR